MRASRSPSIGGGVRSLIKMELVRRTRRLDGVRCLTLADATNPSTDRRYEAPDPVRLCIDAQAAKHVCSERGIEDGTFWYAMLGGLSSRKCVKEVADAILKNDIPNTGLLLAGPMDRETALATFDIQHKFAAKRLQLKVFNRLLSEDEFDAFVMGVDCLVVAQRNEGPSGVLAKAALAGTKVVAAGALSLKRAAETVPGTVIWSRLEGLDHALADALTMPTPVPASWLSERRFADALLGVSCA